MEQTRLYLEWRPKAWELSMGQLPQKKLCQRKESLPQWHDKEQKNDRT